MGFVLSRLMRSTMRISVWAPTCAAQCHHEHPWLSVICPYHVPMSTPGYGVRHPTVSWWAPLVMGFCGRTSVFRREVFGRHSLSCGRFRSFNIINVVQVESYCQCLEHSSKPFKICLVHLILSSPLVIVFFCLLCVYVQWYHSINSLCMIASASPSTPRLNYC